MVVTKQNIKILCAKYKDQLRVSVVDGDSLKSLVEHNVEQVIWDDGDISVSFFPKDNTPLDFEFKFRKKGTIKVKFFDEPEIVFPIC